MTKTAQFRHVGPGGFVAVGFNGMTRVETDQVIELDDEEVAVRPYDQIAENGHEIHRPAQTTADCYRNQPTMWEEIPEFAPVWVPAPTPEEES